MLSFLKNIFFPVRSSFVVEEVDHLRNVVVLEDKQFGLRVEIPIGDKPLKEVKIVAPYVLLLKYEDGSEQKKRILR
jgi:hypothetical protein